MKVFKTFLAVLIGLLVISCSKQVSQENYTAEIFKQKYDASEDETQISLLCKDFMEYAEDINVLRTVEDRWLDADEEQAKAFIKQLSGKNNQSPKYLYLYGRTIDSPIEQIEIGKKIIALDEEFVYGYRLITAAYSQGLFDGDKTSEDYDKLSEMIANDEILFTKYITLDTADSFPTKSLISLKAYNKDFDGALQLLNDSKDKFKRFPTASDYANVYIAMGKYDGGLKALSDEYRGYVESGRFTPEDAAEYTDYYYNRLLRKYEAYDQMVNYVMSDKDYAQKSDGLYSLACAYSLSNDTEKALTNLDKAIKKGWDKVNRTATDTDLEPLHQDTNWGAYMARIQKNWDDSKPVRKKEALEKKISEDAPAWNLEDVNGQMVSLESLKGNIVVLDFWATWCGPCRIAMPMIDNFVENHAGENVKVFSINVWEKAKIKAAKFMVDNEYDMTLLYGNDDLTKAYGVDGIPTLVIIDKEGKIRYKESGVSEKLGENLIWWTEDLQ